MRAPPRSHPLNAADASCSDDARGPRRRAGRVRRAGPAAAPLGTDVAHHPQRWIEPRTRHGPTMIPAQTLHPPDQSQRSCPVVRGRDIGRLRRDHPAAIRGVTQPRDSRRRDEPRPRAAATTIRAYAGTPGPAPSAMPEGDAGRGKQAAGRRRSDAIRLRGRRPGGSPTLAALPTHPFARPRPPAPAPPPGRAVSPTGNPA